MKDFHFFVCGVNASRLEGKMEAKNGEANDMRSSGRRPERRGEPSLIWQSPGEQTETTADLLERPSG